MLRFLAWVLAAGVAAAMLFGLLDRIDLGEAGWLFDLFAHFPRQLAVAALIVAILTGVVRAWAPTLLALVAVAINVAIVVATPRFAIPETAPAGAQLLRVVSANVHADPEVLKKLAALAREYKADLVSVYEAPAISDEQLASLFPGMTTNAVRQSQDGRNLSRNLLAISAPPISPIAVSVPGKRGDRAMLRYSLSMQAGQVAIVAAHPASPGSPAGMMDRNHMLQTLADGLDQTKPFVVMGDFTASPWSRAYGLAPGLRAGDPRLEVTFPTVLQPVGVPIDHIMFGGGLTLTEYHVGADIGSDHFPLLATFALPH